MKRHTLLPVVVLLCSVALWADSHSYSSGGLKVWLPEGWRVEVDETALFGESPDGGSFVLLEVMEGAEGMDEARGSYLKALQESFPDFELEEGEGEEGEINGIRASYFRGNATKEGKGWSLEVVVLVTERTALLFIDGVAEQKVSQYAPITEKIIKSLEKI